jgi:hypothetical protein
VSNVDNPTAICELCRKCGILDCYSRIDRPPLPVTGIAIRGAERRGEERRGEERRGEERRGKVHATR